MSSLDALTVLDRLEVGPVRLEPRRLVAPYRVAGPGVDATTELVYRYEEDVFDPAEPASANLAALIAAQVALNYGLFCHELVLHGPFDRHDRRFLVEMARNTAREIYVKKLLEPNPFLRPGLSGLEPQRQDSYLKARLVFPDPEPATPAPWSTDRSRHAILSSGGKESLLSHALLSELGLETHPIFVNESGRHWFTALNAHRYFAREVPRTGRVWTSCDRLFAWMLRQLPFIRQDFTAVRSDEYPIRLWTVAVFLFGVLPVVRARGVGRLIIGDEHDTTRKAVLHGIPHFDGLFDQSRFFDQALSRFFARKGWGLTQLSILRPLSELLVQKTLVERYPELQRLQVSCHAAHTEDGIVRPCGRCEKCRRVVGMLRAVGADPTRCGYTAEQIDACLRSLASAGAHQESAGEQQMLHMLLDHGRLPEGVVPSRRVRARPEILSLRFDRLRSPLDGVPLDLRRGLLRILLEHADGAMQRRGRVWLPLESLLDQPALSAPYRLEPPVPAPSQTESSAQDEAGTAACFHLGELTWPEAEQRLARIDVALLPVGAFEQHGPHLPLDTDGFDAAYLAEQVAVRSSDPKPLVLPLLPYGISYHHDDFPGTISVSNESLTRMVHEIGMSCARFGVTKLVIVNGHGGNTPALQLAAQMINRDASIFTCVDSGETSDVDVAELCETPNDVHAGEIETSTSLATRPHLVHLDRAEPMVPDFSSRFLDFSARRSIEWYARTARISPSGVLGDPTRATADKGRRIWELMIANLVELVEELKSMSLDEIYERRY